MELSKKFTEESLKKIFSLLGFEHINVEPLEPFFYSYGFRIDLIRGYVSYKRLLELSAILGTDLINISVFKLNVFLTIYWD